MSALVMVAGALAWLHTRATGAAALYALAALSWSAVGGYTLPSLGSIFAGARRYGDGARLMVLAWSLLMVAFLVRRIVVYPMVDPSMAALLIASIVIAFLTWRTAKGYGRGWRI